MDEVVPVGGAVDAAVVIIMMLASPHKNKLMPVPISKPVCTRVRSIASSIQPRKPYIDSV